MGKGALRVGFKINSFKTSDWNGIKIAATLVNYIEDKTTRGQDDKRTRRQEDKTTRGQDDKKTRRQEDKTTRGQEDKRTRRQEDKTTRRQEDNNVQTHWKELTT